jgi:hypothetical protein
MANVFETMKVMLLVDFIDCGDPAAAGPYWAL